MQLKKFAKKYKRQIITAAALAAVVYVFVAIGIFSYYQSNDRVTNRITSKNGSVTLYEPQWDNNGQQKAHMSEPGMTIEKDPYAYNNGQVDLYVRLKMTIKLSGTSDVSNQDQKNAILGAIKYKNNSGVYVPFLTQSNTCVNDSYYMDQFTIDNTDTLVMYFYYTNSDEDHYMQRVRPNESTPELFNRIDIPIYTKDYLGIFDKPYDIVVEAQALPADNFIQIPRADDTTFLQKWSQ